MTYLRGFGTVPLGLIFVHVRFSIKWIDTSITNQNQSKINHSKRFYEYTLETWCYLIIFYLQKSTYSLCVSLLYDSLQLLDIVKLLKCTSWRRSIGNCMMCNTTWNDIICTQFTLEKKHRICQHVNHTKLVPKLLLIPNIHMCCLKTTALCPTTSNGLVIG